MDVQSPPGNPRTRAFFPWLQNMSVARHFPAAVKLIPRARDHGDKRRASNPGSRLEVRLIGFIRSMKTMSRRRFGWTALRVLGDSPRAPWAQTPRERWSNPRRHNPGTALGQPATRRADSSRCDRVTDKSWMAR